MRTRDAFMPESFVLANMPRGEMCSSDEKHFHAKKHNGNSDKEACKKECFHRSVQILCKYRKGKGKYCSKSILFCNLWCFSRMF